MIQEKLIGRFGNHINHMSCIYLHEGEKWLRFFLEEQKPKVVLEIGTYQGVSAAIISEYAEKVFTIDIEEQELVTNIFGYLNIENVERHIVKNRNREKILVKKIFEDNNIDLVFIDGEHFHGELAKDWDMVKKCNNILVHDYDPSFQEVYEFCNSKKNRWDLVKGGYYCLLTKRIKASG